MTDLTSATRWLAAISTGVCVFLFVALGAMCNALNNQQQLCADRARDAQLVREMLVKALERSNETLESTVEVVDKAARLDYFLAQGQAMEAFRLQLTSDLELDKRPSMGIGGCE